MKRFVNIRFVLAAFWLCIANHAEGQSRLFINEIQVANLDQYIDHSFNYGSWMELYNPADTLVLLQDLKVRHTDAEGEVTVFKLTAQHDFIPAQGFLVLWFDHYTGTGYYGSGAAKQVNLEMDADGGRLELLYADSIVVDAADYPASVARSSWLRTIDGGEEWGYTAQPSPGASNDGCTIATDRLAPPVVSRSGGVFRDGFRFSVTIPEGATLYYSTDGSVPMPETGNVSDDGLFQVDTTVVFRFLLAREGWLNSPVVTRSFIQDTQGYYLPVVSVSSHPDNFFDNKIGLYVRGTNGRTANNSKTPANQNMDWERPVNVEYFVPDASGQYSEALNQEARFTIFGGWTRFNTGNDFFEHRSSFKLKCDKKFEGLNAYGYPVFGSKPYIKLKSMLVRNGGQDQYCRIKDAAIHELVRTSGLYLDCQAWQPAHVFIDGHYLGMLNLREESNRQFAFSNYGIDSDEIDQWEDEFIIKAGDARQLNRWYNAASNLGRNPNEENWKVVCEVLDVDEYCNYMAAEIYSGNLDWLRGGLKNLKGFCCRGDDGKIHIVFHDLDGGFGDTDMLRQIINNGTRKLPTIFKNMMRYEPFRKQFIDAYCLMGGSVFEPGRSKPIIYKMAEQTAKALAWEGADPKEKVKSLYEALADTIRRAQLLQTLKTVLGLKGEYQLKIRSNVEGARILLNGQEMPTGRFDWVLFPPVRLTAVTPAGYVFKSWNTMHGILTTDSILDVDSLQLQSPNDLTAVYERRVDDAMHATVRINEVSSANDIYISEYGKKSDWLELYNTTGKDIDLAGLYLSDDPENHLKYKIADAPSMVNTVIPAHGYRVVWCDDRPSLTLLHAPFKLENSDSAFVSIHSEEEGWTDSLRYQAQARWQTYGRYADGGSEVALFSRPTIENANSVCTTTTLIPEHLATAIDDISVCQPMDEADILSVEYYNLSGIRVSQLHPKEIYIKKTLYRNGRVEGRKVIAP